MIVAVEKWVTVADSVRQKAGTMEVSNTHDAGTLAIEAKLFMLLQQSGPCQRMIAV